MIVETLQAAANGGIDLPARLHTKCQDLKPGTMALLTLLPGPLHLVHIRWRTLESYQPADVFTAVEAETYLALL